MSVAGSARARSIRSGGKRGSFAARRAVVRRPRRGAVVPTGGQRRLAVVIVSANSAHWLQPCLRTLYEHAGDVGLDVVVVAAGCTDETARSWSGVSPRRTIECENGGFAWEQSRSRDGRRSGAAPEPRHRDPRGHVGRSARTANAAVGRARRGAPGDRRRPALPDDPPLPKRCRQLFEALGSERFPLRAPWLGERESTLTCTSATSRATGRAARSCSFAPRCCGRSAFSTSASSFTGGDGSLLPDQACGLGGPAPPSLTILHHADKAGHNPRSTPRPRSPSASTWRSTSRCSTERASPRCPGVHGTWFASRRDPARSGAERAPRASRRASAPPAFGYALRSVLSRDPARKSSDAARRWLRCSARDFGAPPFDPRFTRLAASTSGNDAAVTPRVAASSATDPESR